ncbi:GNAT family N-acetyltransferase [Krasilnikovia sp. MM14-A1259]|uniref:GNAT family N-acetyltransferase n=1 Tax=Krasilnikovia sp. MM14-A1259 TaxID=3373539 RepID=UPI00399CFCEB
MRHWAASRGEELVGLASLYFDHHDVELDTFGLMPGHIGMGLGAAFLTRTVQPRLARGTDRTTALAAHVGRRPSPRAAQLPAARVSALPYRRAGRPVVRG